LGHYRSLSHPKNITNNDTESSLTDGHEKTT
jgi:hypothetical protein